MSEEDASQPSIESKPDNLHVLYSILLELLRMSTESVLDTYSDKQDVLLTTEKEQEEYWTESLINRLPADI